jgi:hypothetical protein
MAYREARNLERREPAPLHHRGHVGQAQHHRPAELGRGQNVWLYNTTESCTDIVTANFFSDGFYLGMRQGDLVMGAFTTGSSVSAGTSA